MRSPEGKDFYSTGVYRKIVPLERIVSTDFLPTSKVIPAGARGDGDV